MEEINSRLERKRKWMQLLLSVSMVSLMGIFMLSNMIEEYDDESRYTVVMNCDIETEADINVLKEDSYVLEEQCEQIRVEDNRGSLVMMYAIVVVLSIFSIRLVLEAVGLGREINT